MLTKPFHEHRKLVLWLILLLTLGFISTSLLSYFVSKNAIRNEIITNELPLTADNVYSEIQKDLIRTVFVSSMMARDTFLRDWILDGEKDTGKITKYLKEVQQEYDTVTSFFVSEKSRLYYYENGVLKTVSEHDPQDGWYFRVRNLTTPYELNLDTSEAHEKALSIFVNYRVTDYQGRLIGITGVGLLVDSLRQLIDKYQDHYQRNVYLIDKQGKIVLHGSEFQLGIDNIHAIPGLKKQAGDILHKTEGMYEYQRDGSIYQLNARFIPELNWYLIVEKSESEAFSDISNTLLLNLGICAAITIFVALITGLSVGRHQTRLRHAVENHTNELNAALGIAKAANEAKNEMLAYISHDLRSPLTTILHYIQLHCTAKGDIAQQYQTRIEQSILHQLELIDELMEYSRNELEQLKLLPAPTYLYAFLEDLAGQGELLAAHQNNQFSFMLEGDIPTVVVIDSQRLRQVLHNLLSNAAKFTSGGDIRLLVENVSKNPGSIRYLRFTIADSGPGIHEDDQKIIFQSYERAKSNRPGFGLGLTIASRIVQKMGSELKLASVAGDGSRFWFDIPLEAAKEQDVLQSIQAFPMPEAFGTGKCVLIVEDNQAAQDYLTEILSMADFDVVGVTDIEQAKMQLAGSTFDAVLITQADGEQGAWTLLCQLQQTDTGKTTPTILYSAKPPQHPNDVPEGINFQSTLLKPVSPEKLLETMQHLCSKNNSEAT